VQQMPRQRTRCLRVTIHVPATTRRTGHQVHLPYVLGFSLPCISVEIPALSQFQSIMCGGAAGRPSFFTSRGLFPRVVGRI
jgi:hypothetical protein